MPLLVPAALGLALTFAVTTALAQATDAYPNKPVRLIIATQTGGSNDIIGRALATSLGNRLGRQIIVDNRGGAGGVIGVETAARAAPDGYTILFVNATQSIQPSLRKLPYEPIKSFSPIAKLGSGHMALVVHSSVAATSAQELIALAKRKPGSLIFAGPGSGSIVHLATELFKSKAGIDFRIVQFKSAGPALVDLVGGHSNGMVATIASVLPHIKAGRLRALGSTGLQRSALLPDVPTLAESAVPGYDALIWYGLLAPAGTPATIIDRLNRELKTVLASDEIKTVFTNIASEVEYLGPKEFGAFFQREIDQWAQVINKANLKLTD